VTEPFVSEVIPLCLHRTTHLKFLRVAGFPTLRHYSSNNLMQRSPELVATPHYTRRMYREGIEGIEEAYSVTLYPAISIPLSPSSRFISCANGSSIKKPNSHLKYVLLC